MFHETTKLLWDIRVGWWVLDVWVIRSYEKVYVWELLCKTFFLSSKFYGGKLHTLKLAKHRSQIWSYNCLNCYMRVVYYIFTSAPGVVRIHFRTNPTTQVFWENQFFSFCGVPKNIFWPQKPYLALETPTLGGSYF